MEILTRAIIDNDQKKLLNIIEKNQNLKLHACTIAIKNDLVEPSLHFLLDNTNNDLFIEIAIYYGSLNILKYFYKNGHMFKTKQMIMAIKANHSKIILFLVDIVPLNIQVTNTAIEYNQLDLLKKLRSQGVTIDPIACTYAASKGYYPILKFLYEQGFKISSTTCAAAARVNSLECLEFCEKVGTQWDADTISFAAGNNSITCLNYAIENNCPRDAKAIQYAASNNYIDCLQILLKNKFPMDYDATAWTAAQGHLEALKILFYAGAPIDKNTMEMALSHRRTECIKFGLDNNFPKPSWFVSV